MAQIGKGCQYFQSLPSILKMAEFVVLLIAIGAVGYFFEQVNSSTAINKKGNLKFFLFAVIVAWILVITFFLVFVSGLHQKMTIVNWSFTVVLIFAVWAVVLLIASAFLADAVKHYEDRSICKLFDDANRKEQCEHLIVGAVCGFIATVLFVVDVIIHFGRYTTPGPTTTTVQQ